MTSKRSILGQEVFYCEGSYVYPATVTNEYPNGRVDLLVYKGEAVARTKVRWGSGDGYWAWREEDH